MAVALDAQTAIVADALIDLPKPEGGKHYELHDGELIVVGNAGSLHELIKTRLFEILTEYRLRTQAGRAFSETQFNLRADRARIPDVAWVSRERLVLIPRGNNAIGIAPDIAVEVISDSEHPGETEQQLLDYLEAGVEVWQVFPATRGIAVWQGDQGRRLNQTQMLTSDRLPEFRIRVSVAFDLD